MNIPKTAFRGLSNVNYSINSTIERLLGTEFGINKERDYLNYVKKTDFLNFQDIELEPLKILARCQHYGICSRLIDVSFKYYISLYFASNSQFDESGKIIYFEEGKKRDDDKSKNIVNFQSANDDSLKINHKLQILVKDDSVGNKINVSSLLKGKDGSKTNFISNITSPLIIYNKKDFTTGNDIGDIRYVKQNGGFLLLGNKVNMIDADTKIEFHDTLISPVMDENKFSYLVSHSDKLLNIFYLSLIKETNFVTIYPDHSKSLAATKIINAIKCELNSSQIKYILKVYLEEHYSVYIKMFANTVDVLFMNLIRVYNYRIINTTDKKDMGMMTMLTDYLTYMADNILDPSEILIIPKNKNANIKFIEDNESKDKIEYPEFLDLMESLFPVKVR